MYRIMIVEDDEVIARAVQQSLVSWGMDAFCVQDFSGVLAEFAGETNFLEHRGAMLDTGKNWRRQDLQTLSRRKRVSAT